MESLVSRVADILVDYPECRDDDKKLTVMIWSQELNGIPNLNSFFEEYKKGTLSLPDTITRKRRLVQEKIPSLRGESFDKRQATIPKRLLELKIDKKKIREDIKKTIQNLSAEFAL